MLTPMAFATDPETGVDAALSAAAAADDAEAEAGLPSYRTEEGGEDVDLFIDSGDR